MKKRIKRHSFLLLELLIAFSLITLFAFPLIFNPMQKLENELVNLEKMEEARLSELTLVKMKEKLYRNKEIPFKSIPAKRPKTPQDFDDHTLILGSFKEKKIHFDIYYYWKEAPVANNDGTKIGLLALEFFCSSKKEKKKKEKPGFSHRVFIYAYPQGDTT